MSRTIAVADIGGTHARFALAEVDADRVISMGEPVAGGLGYRLKDRFATSGFADRLIARGRFERRMEGIPVKLLNHPHPGLFGAGAALAREFA
jgi:glucokinase